MAAKRDLVKPVTIMITRWERDLILRYGYPFEDIKRQLKEAGEADLVRVTDSPFWWERVIVNLRISEDENASNPELAANLRAFIVRVAKHLEMT